MFHKFFWMDLIIYFIFGFILIESGISFGYYIALCVLLVLSGFINFFYGLSYDYIKNN